MNRLNRAEPRVDAFVFDLFGVIISFDNDLVTTRIARHCTDPDDAFQRLDGLMARREIITGEVTLPKFITDSQIPTG